MIKDKDSLKYYLDCDKEALGIVKKKPNMFGDEIWKFEILLRKTEYYKNTKNTFLKQIIYYFYRFKFYKMSMKLGFSIPLNVFEEGLSIAHYGTIVINGNSRVGKYCRIQENVNIGSNKGDPNAPILGDYVFIGSGAKIIGNINIADYTAIGANAVVTKSFYEKGITLAGIPAKKISNKDSKNYLLIKNRA